MEYKHLYMNMIEELQLRKDDYEELLVYYFMQLLILLHRQILVKPHKKNPMIMDDMAQAVDYFRMHYNKQINIEKYAALLCTLESILNEAAGQYEDLMANHVRETQLHISN